METIPVQVRVKPEGAVLVDGRRYGQAEPGLRFSIAPGSHEISVRCRNADPVLSHTIHASAGLAGLEIIADCERGSMDVMVKPL